MEDIFNQLEILKATEKRVAMATLVATRGTGPRKEGAKMWVGEGGRILGSVTIGGCIDARVIEESEASLAAFEPRVFSVSMGEEDAWETGFTCAGSVQVMVEPLDLTDGDGHVLNLYREVRAGVTAGTCSVMATPLDDTSSKLVVFEDGRILGSLGNEGINRDARALALDTDSETNLVHSCARFRSIEQRSILRGALPATYPDSLWSRPGLNASRDAGEGDRIEDNSS